MISLARYTEHNCHALIHIYLWLVKSLRLLTNALVRKKEIKIKAGHLRMTL
jgi:hypothetical protein